MNLSSKILTTQFGEATNIYTSFVYGSNYITYIGWHKESEQEQYSIWKYKDGSLYYCRTKI